MIPQQKIKSPKTVACIMLGLLFFAGVIVFFTLGGVFYAKQGPRVSHYANTMCTVDSRSWKMYQCKSRYYYYTCYGPIWGVHYKLDRPISATVEQDERYSSYSDALNKAYQYQVSHSEKLAPHVIEYCCWSLLSNLYWLFDRLVQTTHVGTIREIPPWHNGTNPVLQWPSFYSVAVAYQSCFRFWCSFLQVESFVSRWCKIESICLRRTRWPTPTENTSNPGL